MKIQKRFRYPTTLPKSFKHEPPITIIIKQWPPCLSNDELADLFSDFGTVQNSFRNKNEFGQLLNTGCVIMNSSDGELAFTKLNGTMVGPYSLDLQLPSTTITQNSPNDTHDDNFEKTNSWRELKYVQMDNPPVNSKQWRMQVRRWEIENKKNKKQGGWLDGEDIRQGGVGLGGKRYKQWDVNIQVIILLGDSAVGKSKLMERFLLNDYIPYQSSTYALTLYRYTSKKEDGTELLVDFWDTAGQERFLSMHSSYYHGAHCCIMVFDITRKITYKNLDIWYKELVQHQGIEMPVILVANKIDMEPSRATKSLNFVQKRIEERGEFPFYFVSASDGSNVVTIFEEAIKRAAMYKQTLKGGNGNFVDQVLEFMREEEARPDGMFGNQLKSTIK